MSVQWSNWLGNQRATAHGLTEPTTTAEVVAAVSQAKDNNQRVRVLGGGFAWSPLVPVDGILLSTQRMRRVRHIDAFRHQITIESGAPLRELVAVAAQHGMAINSPSMFLGLSVGGLLATGSHGTGRNAASFGDAVVGFELVTPSGAVVQIDEPGGELWRALLSNLGTLGVVTAVTLQCLPMFNIEEENWLVNVNESGAMIPRLLAEYEFVELFWSPSAPVALIKVGNRTERTAERLTGRVNPSLMDHVVSTMGFAFPLLTNFAPLTTPVAKLFYSRIGVGSHVVTEPQYFHYNQSYPMVISSEFAIPVEQSPDAWTWVHRRLMKYWGSGIRPVNLVAHARFCKGSEGYLASGAGRETCHLEVLSMKGNRHRGLFGEEFDQKMHDDFDGRPHWGKEIWNASRAAEGYGANLDAFLDVRRELDPEQRFLNPWLRDEVFGLGRRVVHRVPLAAPRLAAVG